MKQFFIQFLNIYSSSEKGIHRHITLKTNFVIEVSIVKNNRQQSIDFVQYTTLWRISIGHTEITILLIRLAVRHF